MKLADLLDDVTCQVMEMLLLHEASTLGKTCSRLQDNFLRIEQKLDQNADLDIIENKGRITTLSISRDSQWKKRSNVWIELDEIIEKNMLKDKRIRQLKVWKTTFTPHWCQKIADLTSKSNLQVNILNMFLYTYNHDQFTETFGLLLKSIGANIVTLDETPQTHDSIQDIIDACKDKTKIIKYRYRNHITLTYRNYWCIRLSPTNPYHKDGYFEWFNPDFSANPSHSRYDSQEFSEYCQKQFGSSDVRLFVLPPRFLKLFETFQKLINTFARYM